MVKNDFKLCMTNSYDVEPLTKDPSITQVMERLDLNVILQRAQMGIVDLAAYQRSTDCDIQNRNVTQQSIEGLMDRPPSVMDKTFGFSREDGASELNRHRQVAMANSKKVEKKPDVEKDAHQKDADKEE